MNENIKALIKKVMSDKELQAKFQALRDPDEAYKLASSIQSGFTKEEFIAAMTELKNTADEVQALSPDELQTVAGGSWSSAWYFVEKGIERAFG